MLRVSIQTRQLEEKIRKALNASPKARQEGLKVMVDAVMKAVDETAPRDTNAFANGWAIASNSLGFGPFAIRSLERTKRKNAARLGDWLRSSVAYWGHIVSLNAARDRQQTPSAKRAQERLERARNDLRRFEIRNPNIVPSGGDVAAGTETRGTTKFYIENGRGEVQQASDRTYFRLTNERRGARFIEGRFRTVQLARAPFKRAGLSSMGGKTFASKVAIAAGFASPLRRKR